MDKELEKRLLNEAMPGKMILFKKIDKYGDSRLECGFLHDIEYRGGKGTTITYATNDPLNTNPIFRKTYRVHIKNIKEFIIFKPGIKRGNLNEIQIGGGGE